MSNRASIGGSAGVGLAVGEAGVVTGDDVTVVPVPQAATTIITTKAIPRRRIRPLPGLQSFGNRWTPAYMSYRASSSVTSATRLPSRSMIQRLRASSGPTGASRNCAVGRPDSEAGLLGRGVREVALVGTIGIDDRHPRLGPPVGVGDPFADGSPRRGPDAAAGLGDSLGVASIDRRRRTPRSARHLGARRSRRTPRGHRWATGWPGGPGPSRRGRHPGCCSRSLPSAFTAKSAPACVT